MATLVSPNAPRGLPDSSALTSSYLRARGLALNRIASSSPSLPVGILACQRDPLLRELRTQVFSAKKAAVTKSGAVGASKKDKAEASAEDESEEWQVMLRDTIVFPEGGGQPWDTGALIVEDSSSTPPGKEVSFPVKSAIRRNLDAIHIIHVSSSLIEQAQRLLIKGAEVRVLVDWDRREDHMQQHTGQHLLSACLDALRSPLPTLSWALTTWPQPCYVELSRAPTEQELEVVEKRVNSLIQQSRPIHVLVEGMDEAQTEAPKLPQDYAPTRGAADGVDASVNTEGVIRTVTIDGINQNPCCGTHAPSLAFLRYLHIYPGTTKIRGINARLYFSVGNRAFNNLHESFDVAAAVSRALDCQKSEADSRLQALLAREKALRKREARLREEVALSVAEEIVAAATASTGDASPRHNYFSQRKASIDGAYSMQVAHREKEEGQHLCAVALHRDDADVELLTAISREVGAAYAAAQASHAFPTLLLALSSGLTAPAMPLALSASTESLVLVAFQAPSDAHTTSAEAEQAPAPPGKTGNEKDPGSKANKVATAPQVEALVAKAGDEVRASFGSSLRGGGKGKWQGKLVASEGSVGNTLRWNAEDFGKIMHAVTKAVENKS